MTPRTADEAPAVPDDGRPTPPEVTPSEAAPAAVGESDWSSHDIVEEWGLQSFPASDAPANW